MNPALLGQLLPYLALAPQAIEIVSDIIEQVKQLRSQGPVTHEALELLAAKIQANHSALPVPEE